MMIKVYVYSNNKSEYSRMRYSYLIKMWDFSCISQHLNDYYRTYIWIEIGLVKPAKVMSMKEE